MSTRMRPGSLQRVPSLTSRLPMFINARTDVFAAATQTRNPLAEALARGAAYAAADGIFVSRPT